MSTLLPLTRLLAEPGLAIGEETVVCLICGRTFRRLTAGHLRTHGTAPAEYRARFGYSRAHSLMSDGLRRRCVGPLVRRATCTLTPSNEGHRGTSEPSDVDERPVDEPIGRM